MKTKYKKIISCAYCIYNDTGKEEGERDEQKGICFRCDNYQNFVDMRNSPVQTELWPEEKELIGRGD